MNRRKFSKKPRKAKRPLFQLPVGFTEYDVYAEDRPDHGDGEVLAFCNSTPRRKIVFSKKIPLGAQRAALWHEFFHAIFYELGWLGDWDNEAKVEALANAVMRVRMNKATRWL